MRRHREIIEQASGPHAVARRIAERVGDDDLAKVQSRVRGWSLQDSIPGEYWQMVVDLGITTLEELAGAAEARKLPDVAATRRQTDSPHEAAA